MKRLEFDPTTMTQLATRIPRSLHRRLLLVTVTNEVTMKDFVADALATHLAAVRATPATDADADPPKPAPPSRGRRGRASA